jgi:hypothetical protein
VEADAVAGIATVAAAAKPSTSVPGLPRLRNRVACRVAVMTRTAVRPRRRDTNLIF